MALLARREHATDELRRKLCAQGFDPSAVAEALTDLREEGLLSDARFALSFVGSRVERGHGPRRIRHELQARGLDDALIDQSLHEHEREWPGRIDAVRRKRFGATVPGDLKERLRQARFLQYRGFTSEQIRAVLDGDEQV